MPDFYEVTPTWVHTTEFDTFHVQTTMAEDFTKEFFLITSTPNRQYEFQFLGLSDADFAKILAHYRAVSGPYAAFNFMSFSPQFSSIFGRDLTPISYRDLIISNANDLDVTGAIVCKGSQGKAWGVELNGIDDWLAPDPSGSTTVFNFNYFNNFSIAIKMKVPEDQIDFNDDSNYIISKRSGSSYPFDIGIYNSTAAGARPGQLYFYKRSSEVLVSVESGTLVNDNRWHQATFVRGTSSGTSKLSIYVDTSLANDVVDDIVGSSCTNTANVEIGKFSVIGDYLKAEIDRIIIYDIELSAASIALLYAGTTTLTNKVGYWDFHDDVSMRGRWTSVPKFEPKAKNWEVNMLFEKEL